MVERRPLVIKDGRIEEIPSGDIINAAIAPAEVTLTGIETLSNKTLIDPKIIQSINAQTGTTYTLALSDNSKKITMDNASANTVIIPSNTLVDFPIGTNISVIMLGVGATSITSDVDVIINGISAGTGVISTQYTGVTLIKIATNSWLMQGNHNVVSSGVVNLTYEINIASGTVNDDLIDFPLMINLSDMPLSFWDNVSLDGGNIRAYENNGITQIPFDITYIDLNRKLGRIFLKTNITTASTTVVVLKIEDGLTSLSPNHIYGRNNVWNDYEVVWQFPEEVNRTGKTFTQNLIDTEPRTDWIRVDYYEFINNPHQGIAVDATNLITIDTNNLQRFSTTDFTSILVSNSNPVGDVNTDTGETSLNHAGDGCIVSNELWLPIAKYPHNSARNEWLAVYDATTLTYKRSYNVTSGTTLNSSICHDGGSLFYCCDYEDVNVMRTYNSSGILQSTITLSTPVSNAQGIEYVNGIIYIACSDTNNATYAFEIDGTYIGEVYRRPTIGIQEGISYDGTHLWSMDGDGDLIKLIRNPDLADWRKIHYKNVNTNITPLSTTFTMASSVYWTVENGDLQQGFLSYGKGTSSGNRLTLAYHGSTNKFALWNSSDGWADGLTNPIGYETHRIAVSNNDTIRRKMWVNGAVEVTDSPVNARPISNDISADFVVNASNSSNAERGEGYYQNIWLRHEEMSDAWMKADYDNFHASSTFYNITQI